MRVPRFFVVLIAIAIFAVTFGSHAVAAPTVITACNLLVSTDAVLGHDLACPGTSGIIIGASGITIDLQGHTLSGDRTDSTFGVKDLTGFDDLTVVNGSITKFAVGVDAEGVTDRVHIKKIVAAGNKGDGIYVEGSAAQVTASHASGNFDSGMTISGRSTIVSGSEASNNEYMGLDLRGDFVRVTGAETDANNADGIHLSGESSHVTDAIASGNRDDGIAVLGGSAKVAGGQARGNGGNGLYLFGGSERVTTSRASGNGKDGIHIEGSRASVLSSRANSNDDDGVDIAGEAAKVGRVGGAPSSDRNHADANGFNGGLSDGFGQGYFVHGFMTAPVGLNEASGNDDPAGCNPSTLC